MLRTFTRIACILLVAGAVAGGIYLLVNAGVTTPSDPQVETWDRDRGTPPGAARVGRWEHGPRGGRGDVSPRGGPGGHGGHAELSVGRGVGGVVMTLVQIGLIAAVVAKLQSRSRRSGS